MGKLKRLLTAYIFASVVSITVSSIIDLVYSDLTRSQFSWSVVAVMWLVTVGLPTLISAVGNLNDSLGVKSAPTVMRGKRRSIPTSFSFNHQTVDLTPILVEHNGEVITQDELTRFLRVAWSRQRSNRPPFSRTTWRADRNFDFATYDTIMTTLTNNGLIVGRRQGRSGRLLYPPLLTLDKLVGLS